MNLQVSLPSKSGGITFKNPRQYLVIIASILQNIILRRYDNVNLMSEAYFMADNLARFTLRISPYLLEKLTVVADYNGRTKNKEIEWLIRNCIKEYEKEFGEIKSSHSAIESKPPAKPEA